MSLSILILVYVCVGIGYAFAVQKTSGNETGAEIALIALCCFVNGGLLGTPCFALRVVFEWLPRLAGVACGALTQNFRRGYRLGTDCY